MNKINKEEIEDKKECIICGADPELTYVNQETRRCNVCRDNGY